MSNLNEGTMSQRMKRSRAALERWEEELGFPSCGDTCPVDTADVDMVLAMDRRRLSELSGRQAAEYAFVLAQFAFYVQRRANRCHAFIRWANYNRRAMSGNDAVRLERLKQDAEIKITRIEYLTKRLEFMSQCLHRIGWASR